MKKTFQKTLIAASVGAVLAAASIGAQAAAAANTNLLFPFITTKVSAYTFISISQQGGTVISANNPTYSPLHFTYATKPLAGTNADVCAHVDGDAYSTRNDLMQFELQNKVNVPAMFGDTTSVPKYFPAGAAGADQQGFLIVNNDSTASYGGGAYTGATLTGEARIIDTATGLYMGYSTNDLHGNVVGGYPVYAEKFAAHTGTLYTDYAALNDTNGPDALLPNKVVQWFPTPTVTTTFYMLPLGNELNMGYAGNLQAKYTAAGAAIGSTYFYGHYNNNEGFQSATASVSVTCFGIFDRETLLGGLNSPWSVNGGWANLMRRGIYDFSDVANTQDIGATNALIYKFENTAAWGGNASFITRTPVLNSALIRP